MKNIIRPYYFIYKDLVRKRYELVLDNNIFVDHWYRPYADWFNRFINYHINNKYNRKVYFYNTFVAPKFLRKKENGIKIFFASENLEPYLKYINVKESEDVTRANQYFNHIRNNFKDYAINEVDLTIGCFVNKKSDKYIRLPGWILYLFKPESTYEDIKEKIYQVNNIQKIPKYGKATVINSHDKWGTRSKICDDIKEYIDIEYAGRWRNNTNDLKIKYNDDKIKYMSNFKFNICAENMDASEYVTEKLIQAFMAGTVPIYHGAFNNPCPDFILRDGIIFWDYNDDNYYNLKLLSELIQNENLYFKFLNQPKFTEYTIEYIYMIFMSMKNKIELLINQ